MNTNKPAVPNTTVTRNVNDLDQKTGNIYESLVIISKRANQISNNMKEELHGKLAEFASSNDNLEEIFENREQIEISKHYERMPKPSLIAVDEFLNDKSTIEIQLRIYSIWHWINLQSCVNNHAKR